MNQRASSQGLILRGLPEGQKLTHLVTPLGDGWKVVELDLDKKMSAALVKCFFFHRGEAFQTY